MTNVRLIGYTALAVGLINWRYIDFNAGSFALALGLLVLLASLIKPLHAKIEKQELQSSTRFSPRAHGDFRRGQISVERSTR